MKHQVYLGIAARIIALFTIAMLMTYVPDQLRTFFGDIPCSSRVHEAYDYKAGKYVDVKDCSADDKHIYGNWYWGARHYWYAWMIVLLFILSIVNVVMSIVNLVRKHYDIEVL
jgi:hypothetical protein